MVINMVSRSLCAKLSYYMRDEKKASREYRVLAKRIVKSSKLKSSRVPSMARDESKHRSYLLDIRRRLGCGKK